MLDRVLAGPFLRYTTASEANVWFATSAPLGQEDFVAEFWDPTDRKVVDPRRGIAYEPIVLRSLTNIVGKSNNVQSTRVASRLHVHVVRVSFSKRLQPNKVYAYRLLLDPNVGTGVPVGAPGILDRLVDRRSMPPNAKKFASFVLGDPTHTWLLGLPAQDWELIKAASEILTTAVTHPKTTRATTADLQPLAGPTSLFFFGNPFTFSEQMPEAVVQGIVTLASELAEDARVGDERIRAVYAAAYLLAWSPNLWKQNVLDRLERSVDTKTSRAEARKLVASSMEKFTVSVEANAILMANTPSYMLGTTVAPTAFTEHATTGLSGAEGVVVSSLANLFVNGTFADWPNTPQTVPKNVSTLDLIRAFTRSKTSVAKTFVVPGLPSIGCVASGDPVDSVLDPKVIPDRIATAISVDPVLRLEPATSPSPPPKSLSAHDVTFILTMTQQAGYIIQSVTPLSEKALYATDNDGKLQGKIYEVGASLEPPPTNQSSAQAQRGFIPIIPDSKLASIASIQRQGNTVTLALYHAGQPTEVALIKLPGHGRLVALRNAPDGMHLGNRMLQESSSADLKKGQGDEGRLAGVKVGIYAIAPSFSAGAPAPPLATGTATATGLVNLVALDSIPDGTYELRIEGTNQTFDHAGPDTPILNGNAFKERVWMQHKFPVDVAGGGLMSIDHEPLPNTSFRLLIDPVWMSAHPSRSAARPAGQRVELVVIHSTDSNDIGHSMRIWIRGDAPNTGPHYVVGRDGTTIKLVDESRQAYHAATGQWRNKSRVPPPPHAPSLNPFSVGIETTKTDDSTLYTERQYESLFQLVTFLVGLDTPKQGASHARERQQGRANYVDIAVGFTEVIGHADNRFVTDRQGNLLYDVLGGKHDPGLSFEWARFETPRFRMPGGDPSAPSVGIGLQRQPPPSPVLGSQPTGTPAGGRLTPNPEWQNQILEDELAYDGITEYQVNGTALDPNNPVIRSKVFDALTEIGYWAGSNYRDGETSRSNDNDNKPLDKAIAAFRTHFFSGARRTRAPNQQHPDRGEEETGELDKHTVMWIRKVAEFLRPLNRP